MRNKTLIRFAAILLVPALVVDPGFAVASENGTRYLFRKMVPGTIFVQQALEERGIPYLDSQARPKATVFFQEGEITRRQVSRLFSIVGIFSRFAAGFGMSALVAQGQAPALSAAIVSHLNGVSRWISLQINPVTGLAASHPSDTNAARSSVIYDNGQRIMNHIQTGDLEKARKAMDFIIADRAIRKNGEWIVNVADVATGQPEESVCHTGPNLYLGLAAIHLYEVTKDVKYLNFARERWALAEGIQDKRTGRIPMGPRGEATPGDQHFNFDANAPAFYSFALAEHSAEFKALSDLLYVTDTSAPDRQKYQRSAALVGQWVKSVFDPQTNLFYAGTSEVAHRDYDFGVQRPAGVITSHPMDATALILAAFGPESLDQLLGAGKAEAIRKALDDHFKVTITMTSPVGQNVTVTGYDFLSRTERDGRRNPLISDEWSTFAAFADLRFQDYFTRRGDRAKADAYRSFYEDNARNQAIKSAVRADGGLAYAYAQPAPYSYGKPNGFGVAIPRSLSVIGGVSRSLGMLASDPFLPRFGPYAQQVAVDRSAPLAAAPAAANPARYSQPIQYILDAFGFVDKRQWKEASTILERMFADHPGWLTDATTQEQAAARAATPQRPFAVIGPDGSKEDIFRRYAILYHVGTAQFLLAKAYYYQDGQRAKALQAAVTLLRDYPHSQADGGAVFWQPVRSLQNEMRDLYDEARANLGGRGDIHRSRRFDWARQIVNSSTGKSVSAAVALLLTMGLIQNVGAATFGGAVDLPSQLGLLGVVVVALGMVILVVLIRHAMGRTTTDASHLKGSALSRGLYHFLAHPGSFYSVIAGATVISEIINFNIFLHQPPSQDPHAFLAKQVFLLTVGIIFVVRILHLILSSIWMIALKADPAPPPYRRDQNDLPFVTVQIPIRAEPFEVLKMTLDSALAIDYPADHIEIQVIDNSDRVEQYDKAKAYTEKRGAIFLHRDGTAGFKAGNLELGMQTARGTHFLILDADSTVEPAVLLKVMPEFRRDSKLGYVQLRISTTNENYNGITKIMAMGMRAYHRLYESVMNTQGFVKFDGHNGIISREALNAIGGWQKKISEDLATTLKIRMAGFRARYIAYVWTGEEAPTTFHELMKQQRKWSYGTTQILFEQLLPILRSKNLKGFEKADIIFQMASYLTTALGFALLFAYIQFPIFGAIVILVAPYIPIIIANRDRKRDLLRWFGFTTMVFSALLPTLFLGTFNYFIGRKEGFRITSKGGAINLGIFQLIRRNAFAFGSALLFFGFLPAAYPDVPAYMELLPPSAVAMLSILIAPFRLNYSKDLGGDATLSNRTWRHAKLVIRRLVIAAVLLSVTLGPQFRRAKPTIAFVGPMSPIEFALPDYSADLLYTKNAGWPHEVSNTRNQWRYVYWDFRNPIELNRGQVLRIDYELKESNVMGIQLKGIGESYGDKGDLAIFRDAGRQNSVYMVVNRNLKMVRLVFQLGPVAWEPIGGSMFAGLGVRHVVIAPPIVELPAVSQQRASTVMGRMNQTYSVFRLAVLGLLPFGLGAADGSAVTLISPLLVLAMSLMGLSFLKKSWDLLKRQDKSYLVAQAA